MVHSCAAAVAGTNDALVRVRSGASRDATSKLPRSPPLLTNTQPHSIATSQPNVWSSNSRPMLVFVCLNGSTSRLTASSLGSDGPPHAYSRAHGDGHWHTKSKTCSAGAVKLHASNCTSRVLIYAPVAPSSVQIMPASTVKGGAKRLSQPRLSPARSLTRQSPPNPHAPLSNSFVCRDPKRPAQHALSWRKRKHEESNMSRRNQGRVACTTGS